MPRSVYILQPVVQPVVQRVVKCKDRIKRTQQMVDKSMANTWQYRELMIKKTNTTTLKVKHIKH